MDSYSYDTLIKIAIELDLPDLINFCQSSSRTNKLICAKDKFWLFKLDKDFPSYQMLQANPEDNYILLYQLTQLKHISNSTKNIYEINNTLTEKQVDRLISEFKISR